MKEIDINQDILPLYSFTWDKMSLLELKAWVEKRIEKGFTHLEVEIDWGYYSDIDGIDLTPIKKTINE